MPTKDDFGPDHPLPLFLCEDADDLEQAGIEQAWDRAVISSGILKASILVVTATSIAILWVGNPVALFGNITASLVDISAWQPGTGQTPANQSTAGAQALPPARDAPTRDQLAAVSGPADQSQSKISEPSAEILLKQFQAWAGEENARAPIEPVQPAQDAQAQAAQPVQDARAEDGSAQPVQDAPAEVQDAPARPIQKHRHVRRVQNARAEIRPERHPRAQVRREQNARAQAAPVQDPRAQDQSVQNSEAPSFLQSLGWRN